MKRFAQHVTLVFFVAEVASERETNSLQLDAADAANDSASSDALLNSAEFPDWLKQQPNPKQVWNNICKENLKLSVNECASFFHGFESCSSPPRQISDFPQETIDEATHRVGVHNCKVRSNTPLCSYPQNEVMARGGYEDLSEKARRTAVVNVDRSVMTHLVGKDRVWIVEFYADWCPHCRKFSPLFFAIGSALRRAGSSTMLGGVNCEVHADVCQEHNVQGYPTIMVFYHGSDEKVMAARRQYESNHDGDVRIDTLLFLLSNATSGKRGLSQQALAETFKHLDETEGNCQEQREVNVGGGWPDTEVHVTSSARLKDARFMLLYTLRHWISPAALHAKPRAFTTNDLVPLSLWLHVVALNFPDMDLAAKLRSLAAFVSEAAEIPGHAVCVDDWSHRLDALGLPTTGEIAAAVPTDTTCKTETCRLWALIHILTLASQVHWPGMASHGKTWIGIHAFLEHYFRCDVCRKHFLSQVKVAAYGMKDVESGKVSLAVYFWRFHNAVSTRIAAEKKCIQPVLDRRWPQSESCPQCWTDRAGQWKVIDEAAAMLGQDSPLPMHLPNETAVTQHLVRAYWPANLPAKVTHMPNLPAKVTHMQKNSAIYIRSGQVASAICFLTVAVALV